MSKKAITGSDPNALSRGPRGERRNRLKQIMRDCNKQKLKIDWRRVWEDMKQQSQVKKGKSYD